MSTPIELPNIKNITVSGRIGAGATTLAKKLAEKLNWRVLEGGDLFEKIHKELGLSQTEVLKRPDHFDLEYEEKVKKILREESHQIVQSHLAGFDARGIEGVFKIFIDCEDSEGNDKPEIRIDRLINRDGISIENAKEEVFDREKQHTEKWRRLYAGSDPNWVYWDKKYYDLVINTYSHNQEETLKLALSAMGYKRI
ncbi:MAG: cytidylate kinase family protein [Patescibacteria group bacterium]|nr:cytidylate kinase family protein [Patescibacteria group bacterium]